MRRRSLGGIAPFQGTGAPPLKGGALTEAEPARIMGVSRLLREDVCTQSSAQAANNTA